MNEQAQIVVYSGPLCSGCEEVKEYLAAQGIAYSEKNIRADIATMIEFRRKGYDVLPVVEAGGGVVQEYESLDQVKELLRAAGYQLID